MNLSYDEKTKEQVRLVGLAKAYYKGENTVDKVKNRYKTVVQQKIASVVRAEPRPQSMVINAKFQNNLGPLKKQNVRTDISVQMDGAPNNTQSNREG